MNHRNFHKCKLCLYRSKSIVGIRTHVRLHYIRTQTNLFACHSNNPDKYGCKRCNFGTNFKVVLCNHINVVHTGVRPDPKCTTLKCYRCGKCDFHTYSSLVFMRHICHREIRNELEYVVSEGVKWFRCKQCPFKTSHRFSLRRHTLAKHSNPEDMEWHECCQCSFKTKQKFELKAHALLQHRRSNEARKRKSKSGEKKSGDVRHVSTDIKWFECELCPYKTRHRLYDLERHKLMKHSDPEEVEWFKCYHCPYKAKLKFELKTHILTQHKSADVRCERCSFKTKRKRDLDKHVVEKHPPRGKRFKCDHCSYTSRRKYHLKRHVLTKHGDSD